MAQLPVADVHQLGGAYGLGAPREEYGFKIMRTLMTGLLLLAFGFAAIAFIVITEQISFTTMDFSAVDTSGNFWLFTLIGLGLFAVGVWSLVRLALNYDMRVIVYEQGVLRTNNGLTEVVRWEDVHSFLQSVTKHYTNGIYTGTTHRYTLSRSDGTVFKFDDTIRNVEALGNTLQREVTRVLLPRYIYAYNVGNTVTFGPLSISQQGISNGKEMLPWSQVKNLQVKRGVVCVQKEGKWFNWSTVGVARIPNFYVFMALVDYASKGQR